MDNTKCNNGYVVTKSDWNPTILEETSDGIKEVQLMSKHFSNRKLCSFWHLLILRQISRSTSIHLVGKFQADLQFMTQCN